MLNALTNFVLTLGDDDSNDRDSPPPALTGLASTAGLGGLMMPAMPPGPGPTPGGMPAMPPGMIRPPFGMPG